MRGSVLGMGREVLQISEGENNSIPPQAKRKKPHTGNNKPKTIPKPIHNIILGSQGRDVSKNAYLDTITMQYLNI
jgi:hypothetical protein